jgi:hypothetical protein
MEDVSTVDLHDARESLTYWELRAQHLPRRAIRARREAQDMAARWHARVAEAERAEYGRGLLGAMLLVLSEGRLPQPARRTASHVVRRARQAAIALVVAFATLVILACAAFAALIGSIF